MTGKFNLKRAENGKFFFDLEAENGEIIGTSDTYQAKANAQKGIASVKKNAPSRMRFKDPWRGQDGAWYFALKARNGEVILDSRGYVSKDDAEIGISAMQNAADGAITCDLTRSWRKGPGANKRR